MFVRGECECEYVCQCVCVCVWFVPINCTRFGDGALPFHSFPENLLSLTRAGGSLVSRRSLSRDRLFLQNVHTESLEHESSSVNTERAAFGKDPVHNFFLLELLSRQPVH